MTRDEVFDLSKNVKAFSKFFMAAQSLGKLADESVAMSDEMAYTQKELAELNRSKQSVIDEINAKADKRMKELREVESRAGEHVKEAEEVCASLREQAKRESVEYETRRNIRKAEEEREVAGCRFTLESLNAEISILEDKKEGLEKYLAEGASKFKR